MDTKWKKSKGVLSILFLLVGMTLTVIFGGIAVLGAGSLDVREITDSFRGDYQNTRRFRSEMSHNLRTVLEARVESKEYSYPLRDPNLRWGVWENEVFQEGNLSGTEGDLITPDEAGYNFYLYYQNGKVTIWKDGEEVDVYGDGVYRDEWDQWNVPGYQNMDLITFLGYVGDYASTGWSGSAVANPQSSAVPMETNPETADETPWNGLTIRLAAAETPIPFTGYTYSGIYGILDSMYVTRQAVSVVGGCFLLGVALLVWAILWRRWLGLALRAVGTVTGKIWLEVKLAVLIALVGPLLLSISYASEPIFLAVAIAICWLLVFYLNDLACNRSKLFRASFCGWLAGLLRGDGVDQPLQKKLLRGAVMAYVAALILAVGAAVLDFRFFLYWMRYQYGLPWLPLLVGVLGLILLALLYRHWRDERALIEDLSALDAQVEEARQGRRAPALPPERPLYPLSQAVEDVGGGLQKAVEERTRSERMKVELITNVSHDLKTPLTSILSYAELLREEEDLPDHVRDYVRILNDKALRLKTMVQEVFDVSKAASGNLNLNWEDLDLGKLLRQTLADQADPIAESGLQFRVNLPEEPVPVRADGDRLYRVFQNLIHNALQYAMSGSRVYVDLTVEGDEAVAKVQNISREELPRNIDFTERFVRGDESRTDGGSGLGLAIALSFTQACGGTLEVSTDADLFTARVRLPLHKPNRS